MGKTWVLALFILAFIAIYNVSNTYMPYILSGSKGAPPPLFNFTIGGITLWEGAKLPFNTTIGKIELPKWTIVMDFISGVAAMMGILVLIGALIGLRVLGSGISGSMNKVIFSVIFFFGIWGMFSALAFNFFYNLGAFGLLLYTFLMLGYGMDVISGPTNGED